MLPRWCEDTVIVERPALVEKRGSMVYDWANSTKTAIDGCSIQESTTARNMDGRVLQITNGAVLYAPSNADIQSGDRIKHDGHTYVITGQPLSNRGATGKLSHKKIPLEEWSG